MWFLVIFIITAHGNHGFIVNKEPYFNLQQCEAESVPLLAHLKVVPKPKMLKAGCVLIPDTRGL